MDIQAELEEISTVKRKLTVQVPASIAGSEYLRVAREFKNFARVPGFRPGKAPIELIKRRYRKDIEGEVLQKLIPESYEQAVREKGVQPLSQPYLENLHFEEGKPLVYEAHFEVRPEIVLPEYRGLEVEVEDRPVAEEDVEQELEQLRERNATVVSVEDRPVQEGDFAIVDLQGEYLGGKETRHGHPPISEEGVVVRVGDDHTHEAFTQALIGMSVGEEKTFEVDYPSDYPEKKLAGHKLRFTVELTDIKRRQVPDLNDEFARDLGQYDSLEALRHEIRERLEAGRKQRREQETRQKLVEKLVDQTSFEVPETLLEARLDERISDLAYNFAYQGIDPSKANVDWRKVREDLGPEAEREVRGRLILEEIARRENLEVSEAEVEEELHRLAQSMNQPVERVRQYFQREGRLQGLRTQLRRRKALDLVREQARVVESRVSS